MKMTITTWSLEMHTFDELRPSRQVNSDFHIIRVEQPYPAFNKFLYSEVGKDWFWIDKLSWSHDQWHKYVDRPELETWVGYLHGAPAGYYELEKQPGTQIELVYFGILPPYYGQGLGGILLTHAIIRAWSMKPKRVWVHTCSHDHPAALQNYLARGFVLYNETVEEKELPEKSA
ncbi:MAG TPA: GNAT family N-acetyltransferase [bacterium]|nr:GNAT family N-acetyltransferase [bacterium]HPN43491.1 GNAT family N-acetyltransferase [bacterium]